MMPIISPKILLCGAAVAALVGGVIGGWAATTEPPLQEASAGASQTNGLGSSYPPYGCPDPCSGSGGGMTVVNSTICTVTVTQSSAKGAFCAWNFGSTNVNEQTSTTTPGNGDGNGGGDTETTITNTTTTTTTTTNNSNNNNSFNTVITNNTTITNVNNTFINQTTVNNNATPVENGPRNGNTTDNATSSPTTINNGTEEYTGSCEAAQEGGTLGVHVNVQVCNNSVEVLGGDETNEVAPLANETPPPLQV